MRLLLVHGRSQGSKDPVQLASDWQKALDIGLNAAGKVLPNQAQVDFPFYGAVLDGFTAQFDVAVDEVATEKGIGGQDDFAEFAKSVALEVKEAKQIPDGVVKARMVKIHGPDVTEKGPQNWEWVQSIISVLDSLSPGTTEKTFSLFLRDVFLYTRRKVVRKAIDKIVADKLTDEPTVVVGHSLGSVVAYNVLSSGNKKSVTAFITVGSPLGIRGISNSLDIPLRNVAGHSGWFNGYDERDVVALNPLDATYFPVHPDIVNDGTLVNATDNYHGIISYLDKAAVASRIAQGFV